MKLKTRSFTLFLLSALCLFFEISLLAQNKRTVFQYSSQKMRVEKKSNTTRLSNTVIVKLKPEFSDLFSKNDEELKKVFYPLDITSINPLFNPTKTVHRKKETVNLQLIYVVQYNPSTMDVEGVVKFLSHFSYFEYCEPYYTPTPAYIPNDPMATTGGDANFIMNWIKAFDAWDVEQGDPNMIIGIVDTGFEITHDELKNRYVPGWDVADNDANVVHPTAFHGTLVAGICNAEVDNSTGIAGNSFLCKFMPIKATPDAGNAITAGYQGIQYAADNGCNIINLSWGGFGGYSSTLQDYINYAAIDHDIVVVAAAGNSDMEGDFYPAAYDNVCSVAATDTATSSETGQVIDIRSRFRDYVAGVAATYAHSVDISAPGTMVWTTDGGNSYNTENGSSIASPFVAGAAALVRVKYPNLTALQVIELLRVTSDSFDFYVENLPFKEKLGKGRLNMYRALTDHSQPSIRTLNLSTTGKHGTYLLVNDTITLTLDLWNYLRATNDLTVNLSTSSTSIDMVIPSIHPGIIDSMQGLTTTSMPLKFKINSSASQNEVVTFRLGYTDPSEGYYDYQYFQLLINPSMLDISTDVILSTITSTGNIGFDVQGNGEGYQYNSASMLYEGGLLIGAPGNRVSDCIRGTSASPDQEFKYTLAPTYLDPAYKDMEILNRFNDSLAASIIGVSVEQRSYTFNQPGLDHGFIAEYRITNNTAAAMDTLYAALFFDWDIGPGSEYSKNRAGFDYTRKMGYAYSTVSGRPYAGVELLTKEEVTYYAMDNGTVPDVSNINPNSGAWTSTLKYKCMNSGVGRAAAGMTSSSGFDISHMTGAKLLNVAPGETRTIAFAIMAADNLSDLQLYADNLKTKFVQMKTSKTPTGATYYLCDNETKDITFAPSNGNNFNFYNYITDITQLATGKTYTETNVSTADTLYAAGADSLYESTSRVPLYVNNTATAKASFGTQTTVLTIPTDATLYMFNTSQNYTSLTWDYGDGDGSTDINNPSHTYIAAGTYTVSLTASDDKGCNSTAETIITASIGTGIKIFPNPATKSISFGENIKDPGTLQFINSVGQILYEKDNILLSEQVGIDVINWPEGVYTVVFNTDKKQYIEQLLIRR